MRTLIVTLRGGDLLGDAAPPIVVAKSGPRGVLSVVWIAFRPSRFVRICWTEAYGLFAAALPSRAGCTIRPIDTVHPARDGSAYTFRSGRFSDAMPRVRTARGHYDVQNASDAPLALGLLQTAAVNGVEITAPVNLVAVPPGGAADFGPVPDLVIWTQHRVRAGTIVSSAASNALRLSFAPAEATKRCTYDIAADVFSYPDGSNFSLVEETT